MNSSLETRTEINLNIFAETVTEAVTEKLTSAATKNSLENVENVFENITNLTEESQYNESYIDSDGTYFKISDPWTILK